ncbi:MAG: hypothetical protein DWQ01_04365 [Planctomycetota bacterium]|nr:MAG: hypothetical protein DWQ01_04365 [Planctomycetota bacterium]
MGREKPEYLERQGLFGVIFRAPFAVAIPASLLVIEHVPTKYPCKQCQDGVAIAPLPNRPIAKGKPGPGLLAKTVVAKYADHHPLHRQQKIYQREGLDVPKSTLCDWIAASAQLLKPISLEIKR